MKTTISDNIRLDHCNEYGEALVTVEYYKSFQEVIINNADAVLSISPNDIPALIALLQSISYGTK